MAYGAKHCVVVIKCHPEKHFSVRPENIRVPSPVQTSKSKFFHLYVECTPIAQETFGSWGPSGLELLKEIGTRTIIASGNKRARANLFQNISMAMIRGNIINVKSTLPPLNKNQEFLFLN